MENRESVDQTWRSKPCGKRRGKRLEKRREQLRRLLTDQAQLLQTQGAVLESYRQHKGRRLGPYYKLSYREGGRQRSLYLGADAELADEARAALAELQADRRESRRLERARRVLRRELARSRTVWSAELRKIGLYLKGGEVRGWRRRRMRIDATDGAAKTTTP